MNDDENSVVSSLSRAFLSQHRDNSVENIFSHFDTQQLSLSLSLLLAGGGPHNTFGPWVLKIFDVSLIRFF